MDSVKLIYIILLLSCYVQCETTAFPNVPIRILANSLLNMLIQAYFGELLPSSIFQPVNFDIFPALIGNTNFIIHTDKFVSEYYSQVNNEDIKMSVGDLILKYGYPMEVHAVQTEDGYNLKMYRIPNNGSAVFLMHGIHASADDFVVTGPNSLAYLLADEGYDVWMGNARGNKHSRSHKRYDPADAEFWAFSWHEIGYYDLPAMIDYALENSNSETLKYIGHSQGTTVFFVMAAERPEYNAKVSLMVAMAPAAYMSNIKSPIAKILSPGTPLIYGLSKTFDIQEFAPVNVATRWLKFLMCAVGTMGEILCNHDLFLLCSFTLENLNVKNIPVIMSHLNSNVSIKQFIHYGQGIVSGEFRQFDFGTNGNVQRYGQPIPPRYKLERVTAPVSLFYSEKDQMIGSIDVEKLYSELSNAVDIHKVRSKTFGHIDFVYGKDFKRLVYRRLQKLLTLY